METRRVLRCPEGQPAPDGDRVAALIPEPTVLILMLVGAPLIFAKRFRRKTH